MNGKTPKRRTTKLTVRQILDRDSDTATIEKIVERIRAGDLCAAVLQSEDGQVQTIYNMPSELEAMGLLQTAIIYLATGESEEVDDGC